MNERMIPFHELINIEINIKILLNYLIFGYNFNEAPYSKFVRVKFLIDYLIMKAR